MLTTKRLCFGWLQCIGWLLFGLVWRVEFGWVWLGLVCLVGFGGGICSRLNVELNLGWWAVGIVMHWRMGSGGQRAAQWAQVVTTECSPFRRNERAPPAALRSLWAHSDSSQIVNILRHSSQLGWSFMSLTDLKTFSVHIREKHTSENIVLANEVTWVDPPEKQECLAIDR